MRVVYPGAEKMRQALREDAAEADGAGTDDLRTRKRSKGKPKGQEKESSLAAELDAEDRLIRDVAGADGQEPEHRGKGKARGRGKRRKRPETDDTQHKYCLSIYRNNFMSRNFKKPHCISINAKFQLSCMHIRTRRLSKKRNRSLRTD